MEKSKVIAIINAEVQTIDKTCIEDIIYTFICEREIDVKAIRNKAIKSDFNQLYKQNIPTMQIYTELSSTYNISEDAIRYILRR